MVRFSLVLPRQWRDTIFYIKGNVIQTTSQDALYERCEMAKVPEKPSVSVPDEGCPGYVMVIYNAITVP
jgi:hypothetical protein